MPGREADAGTRAGEAGTRGERRTGTRGGRAREAGTRGAPADGHARRRRKGLSVPPDRTAPRLFGRGAAYGCWKPASWRIFCASGVLSQATNAAAASLFLDCFSVAAG